VAMLEPVLQVGAASQTVTVEANNVSLQTSQAEVSAASLEGGLPGGAVEIVRASIGGRVLAGDAAGHLYLSRNAGKSWKKIKPKWTGKAAEIVVVPNGAGRQVFELTTDSGAEWTSEDGKHWRAGAER
jgi:photosystem II stability/assembly factor-like uncharacterized protein